VDLTDTPVADLQGGRSWPLVGSTLTYVRNPQQLFRRQWQAHGPVSRISFLGKPWALLLGPDACAEVLVNRDKAFASGAGWIEAAGPFFGRGLMFLDFAEHHLHRRIMQQAFTRERLEGYTAGMQATIRDGVDGWQPAPRFRAYPALKQLTLDVAAQTFMGGAEHTSPADMERINRAFIDCLQAATGIVRHDAPLTRWRRGARGRAVLEEFLRGYLPSRREREGDDLFSILCHIETDDGERFSDDDVVNHMIFLMMAAHDTSTITLSTMMQHLGQHPDWQQRLRDEAAHLGDEPTLTELDGLAFFDLVMKESLRLVAPVPVLARKTVKETTVQGVRIPAGHFALVAPHFSHHMSEYWTEPEQFDPERFAAPRLEHTAHRHAWDPFGGGVHKCLGMFFAGSEVNSVLHHLLRRFEWRVAPDYRVPMNYHSLPFPNDGQPVDLRAR
jgi:cytochrome P450